MDSLDDDFNETETREFITDALNSKGWKLGFEFPLPPLEEQEAIVEKVEELLPLCK